MIMQTATRMPKPGGLRGIEFDPTGIDERGKLRTPGGMA